MSVGILPNMILVINLVHLSSGTLLKKLKLFVSDCSGCSIARSCLSANASKIFFLEFCSVMQEVPIPRCELGKHKVPQHCLLTV